MSTPDEYRRLAGDCLRAAKEASSHNSHVLYLTMAQAWIDLADQLEARRQSVVSFPGKRDAKFG